jgi:phytoene dehydrogenase-like protein
MSGLAAAVRLAMYDKKVLLLEKHSIPGGLNSYYQRRNTQKGGIRKFDVGLHAMTNFMKKGDKGKPFSKLLKQLRFSYDEFELCPQNYSKIHFPEVELKFSNDFELLLSEVDEKFPASIDEFKLLVKKVQEFNELDLSLQYQSSRTVLKNMLSDELLIEMILCPLLIYGSAWEDDMDFSQFVIMFKSLYFEGFSRPSGGVRTIINLLMTKINQLGAEVRFKAAVSEILIKDGAAYGVVVGGESFEADKIFSSIGLPETQKLTPVLFTKARSGVMTFMESIFVFDKKISPELNDATIIFSNNSNKYSYQKARDLFDSNSAVVCFPDNYGNLISEGEGVVRVTQMANYQNFKDLSPSSYLEAKEQTAKSALEYVKKFTSGFQGNLLFEDTFSPLTIEKYTWHHNGAVYGSVDKTRDGRTQIKNLFIIGTDQGFLGIVGAMLSGISMANLYGLMQEGP